MMASDEDRLRSSLARLVAAIEATPMANVGWRTPLALAVIEAKGLLEQLPTCRVCLGRGVIPFFDAADEPCPSCKS